MSNSDREERGEPAERFARLEERTRALEQRMDRSDEDSVTKDQFEPVRMVVYSLVGTILLSTIAAVLALVMRSS